MPPLDLLPIVRNMITSLRFLKNYTGFPSNNELFKKATLSQENVITVFI